jgi:hypothetical protein
MQSRKIMGPFALTLKAITEMVTLTAAGNFALGTVEPLGFCVLYVGRSDTDVAKALGEWVRQNPRYKAFTFSYAAGPRAAFEKECDDFHEFGNDQRLDNVAHPEHPAKKEWLCPRCDHYR